MRQTKKLFSFNVKKARARCRSDVVMSSFWPAFLFLLALVAAVGGAKSEADSPAAALPTDAEVFRRLLRQKRVDQLTAVKQLLQMDDQRRMPLLHSMLAKIKEVLARSRVKLEETGLAASILAGGAPEDFPAEEDTRSSLAHVVENTCLASDLLLRFPDHLAADMKSDRGWDNLFRFSLSLVEASGLVDQKTAEMLDLAARESGARERGENYHNPYKYVKPKQKRFEDLPLPTKEDKKKTRKKLPRGPRLSRPEL